MKLSLSWCALVAFPSLAYAQGATLKGVVLGASDARPIAEVEVAIGAQSKTVFTNERGEFGVENIAPGQGIVALKRIGYAVTTDTILFVANETVERSYKLTRVATLDTVAVSDRILSSFEEHRKLGLGHFLTRADLEKLQGQPIGRVFQQTPGAAIMPGRYGQAFLLSRRSTLADKNSPDLWCPEPHDRLRGLNCGCYAQVYLDKTLMNKPEARRDPQTNRLIGYPTPPFDINSIASMSMEAVEWYSGPSQTPLEYSHRLSPCGMLIIHSRRTK